jgi:platelet-activating factor acetylhydrolase IB subunit alpha
LTELKAAGAHLLQRQHSHQSFALPQEALFTLKGHQKGVHSIALHPAFLVIATASEDTTIKLWDSETGSLLKTLKGHVKSVNDVKFSEDGALLVSCSSDLTIKVWKVDADYQCVKTLYGHDNTISSVCFIPSLGLLASGSRDESIKVWEISTGFCTNTLHVQSDWIRTLAASDDGELLVTAGADKSIYVWDTTSWTTKVVLRGHTNVVEKVILIPSALNKSFRSHLGVSTGSASTDFIVSTSRDKTVKIWCISEQTCIKTLVF